MVTNAASTLDPAAGSPDGARPSSREPSRGLRPLSAAAWLAVLSVVVVAGVGSLVALDSEAPDSAFALAAVACSVMLAGMFTAQYRASGNVLDPLCLAVIMLFLMYPFHGLMTRDNETLAMLIGSDSTEWLTRALLLATVSAPFVRLGFNSGLAGRIAALLPRPRFELDDDARTTRSKLLILYGVSLAPRLLVLSLGQLYHWDNPDREGSEIQYLLTVLVNVPVFVTVWFLVQGLRKRERRLILLSLAMLGVEFVWGMVSGSRARMLMPLVATVAALSYLHRPMRLKTLVVAATLFVLVLFPFITSFRSAYFGRLDEVQRDGLQSSTLIEAFAEASAGDDDTSFGLSRESPVEVLADRLHGLTSLALVIRFTPERAEYGLGIPYLQILPQILVPRFIWTDKPEMAPFNRIFRDRYWGVDPGSSTSVAVSQFGDLYANLHIVGTTLGSFLYGAFIALLFRHLRYGIRSPSIFPTVVFSVHVMGLIQAFESPFDPVIAGTIKSLFVYFVIAWILSTPRRARAAGA
ncbi:MAG: hypothetical protein IT385_29570 [Deltaproteobacteria bacterium]|nr:hypothetical protein [Deltaproteobacteria bacterium]